MPYIFQLAKSFCIEVGAFGESFISYISVVDFSLYSVGPKEDLEISVLGSSRI